MEGTEDSSDLMLMNFHSINHPTHNNIDHNNGIALTCTFDGNHKNTHIFLYREIRVGNQTPIECIHREDLRV